MRSIAAIAALIAVIATTQALACGVCVEDKIAAAYDHGLIARSLARKHQVAFFALEGQLAGGEAQRRAIGQAAEGARGADSGSARVSLESASLSVAFDPQRASFAAFEKSLEVGLARRGVSLLLLRVMDRSTDLKTVARP